MMTLVDIVSSRSAESKIASRKNYLEVIFAAFS